MREEPRPGLTGTGYRISSFDGNLISRFAAGFCTRELSDDGAPTARSMLARGNAPGTCPIYMLRPERAEDSCALSGRTDRFRNPGRCPGLECASAFSAEIKVVSIQICESWWLAIWNMSSNSLIPRQTDVIFG
jgi:hypothetical protein